MRLGLSIGIGARRGTASPFALGATYASDFANDNHRVTETVGTFSEVGGTHTHTGTFGLINSAGEVEFFPTNVMPRNDRGLFANGAVTNLAPYSEQFDNAAWDKVGCTITPNAAIAPDGTLTADKIVEDTSTGVHGVNDAATVTASADVTAGVFVKAAERTLCEVWSISGGRTIGSSIRVDLTDGSYVSTRNAGSSSLVDYEIVECANGWWWIKTTANSASTSDGLLVNPIANGTATSTSAYTGDGSSGIYVWGGQFAQASTIPVYIPTAGATASIGALSNTVALPAALTDQDMLIFVEAQDENGDPSANPALFSVVGDAVDLVSMRLDANRRLNGNVFAAGLAVASSTLATNWAFGDTHTMFWRRLSGQWRLGYLNAGAVAWIAASTTGAMPNGLDTAKIGRYFNDSAPWTGYIPKAGIIPGTFDTDQKIIDAIDSFQVSA